MALFEEYKHRLKTNYVNFLENLEPHPLLDHLLTEKVLSQFQYDNIEGKKIRRNRVLLLLDFLTQVDVSKDGLDCLIQGLHNTGQSHLANCITGEAEMMEKTNLEIIKKARVTIIENLELGVTLDHLQSKEAITRMDAEYVQSASTRERNGKLLDIISRKPNPVLFMFIDALKETNQKHLAQLLQTGKCENTELKLKLRQREEEMNNLKSKINTLEKSTNMKKTLFMSTINDLTSDNKALQKNYIARENTLKRKIEILERHNENQQYQRDLFKAKLEKQEYTNKKLLLWKRRKIMNSYSLREQGSLNLYGLQNPEAAQNDAAPPSKKEKQSYGDMRDHDYSITLPEEFFMNPLGNSTLVEDYTL